MNRSRLTRFIPLVALLLAVGCSGRSYQVASPVLGPVPPRIPLASADDEAEEPDQYALRAQGGDLVAVAHSDEAKPLEMTDIIAEINGEPILAHQILDRYSRQIEQLKQQSKASKVREFQIEAIEKDLPAIIDQTLMVDALKQTMKPDQLKSIEDQLDKYFETEVEDLMKKSNTGSPTELEGVLQSQGMSLVTLRQQFGDRQLAGQYMRAKLDFEPTVSREEIQARYEADIAEYTHAAEVKWQQIDLAYEKHGSVEAAEAAAKKLLIEIRAGQLSFDDAARDQSDSPIADQGGHRDWTSPESLVDADLQAALGELPINGISAPITTKTGCIIVMTTGRREARTVPFHEVQTDLKQKMVQEKKQAHGQTVIDNLKAKAVIKTILDKTDAG